MPVIEEVGIDGLVVVRPDVHGDERGAFVETYRREWIPGSNEMIQANRADRQAGCFVGMHFHLRQADLWHILQGTALVVTYDLREGSPTQGRTESLKMGPAEGHTSLYIPPGVAHGFWALTDLTITYLVDSYYDPSDELSISWKEPRLQVDWPNAQPILSERDQTAPLLDDLPPDHRPTWGV